MLKTELTILPENDLLNRELESCNREYLELYTLHKEMLDNDYAILTSLYMDKLGCLQLELLEKQTEASRLRMKIKLMQAAFNRDEKPDLVSIDNELDRRLSDYYKEIARQADLLEASKNVLSNLLPEEDAAKLKEIFRVLCKRLHPDLNPLLSEYEKDLFVKVKAAYDMRRISDLQEILLYLDGIGDKRIETLKFDEKAAQVQFLKESIASLKDKIDVLTNSFPFNFKLMLHDDTLLAGRQSSIREQIEKAEIDVRNNQETIDILMSLI